MIRIATATILYAALLAAIVGLTGCATKQPLAWDSGDRTALKWMVACQAADLTTTAIALSGDAREANPLLPSDIGGIAAVKVVATGLIITAAHGANSHRLRRQVLGIMAVLGCVPAAYNASQL